MKSIIFVCHGNICRSPMAEFIMKNLVEKSNIKADISSAAVSNEEIGNDIYPPAKEKLKEHNIPFSQHKAHKITLNEFQKTDYVIVMDNSNLSRLKRIVGEKDFHKVYKMMEFGGNGEDVADPWYTGDFEQTYKDILLGCTNLIKEIECK